MELISNLEKKVVFDLYLRLYTKLNFSYEMEWQKERKKEAERNSLRNVKTLVNLDQRKSFKLKNYQKLYNERTDLIM